MNEKLLQLYKTKGRIILGLQGLQGAGKTTLGAKLEQDFKLLGISLVSVSLDDFYLPYQDRQKLNIKWRGPPGTHDLGLITDIFHKFKYHQEVKVPIFDKSLFKGQGDRIGYKIINPDILLFEGWMVGYQYIEHTSIKQMLLPNNQPFDIDLAIKMNEGLKNYQNTWDQIDFMIQLKLCDNMLSVKWRLDAEQQLIQKTGQGQDNIIDFVSYFWNSLHPELYKTKSDWVINVNENHELIYE